MLHVLFVSADGLTSVATMPHLSPPMRLVRPIAPKNPVMVPAEAPTLNIESREYEYSGRSSKVSGVTIHEYVEVR